MSHTLLSGFASKLSFPPQIEEKNDVSKYLRGIQLEGCRWRHNIFCDIDPLRNIQICDYLHPDFDTKSARCDINGHKSLLFCCM